LIENKIEHNTDYYKYKYNYKYKVKYKYNYNHNGSTQPCDH